MPSAGAGRNSIGRTCVTARFPAPGNGVLPRRFSAGEVERLVSRDGVVPGPVAAAARRQHGQASTQQGQLRRLRRHTSAHVTTLPYVAAPHFGLAEVRALADELARRR